MVMGPLPQFLHCELVPLVGCCVIWGSTSVGQVLCKPFFYGVAEGVYGQERKTHTWNKYLLNACGDQLSSQLSVGQAFFWGVVRVYWLFPILPVMMITVVHCLLFLFVCLFERERMPLGE